MSLEPIKIAPDIDAYQRLLSVMPWFTNLGKPHPLDCEVVRIHSWDQWPGPEDDYVEWFFRWPSVVREQIEVTEAPRKLELDALWKDLERLVMGKAAANVPLYDPKQDAWHGPTICVWCAAFTTCLVAWHIVLKRNLPQRLVEEWRWYADGHWPCGFAVEPPGFRNESAVDAPVGKFLVY